MDSEPDPRLWLRRYVPAPEARTRLVCFPHAGGAASYFHPIATALAPQTDVISLQYPGRQDRRHEPLLPDVATMADQITAVLATQEPLPTVLFGHSLGATLAFEVAWRQEQAGRAPVSLVASGRRGPGTTRDEAVHRLDDEGLLAEIRSMDPGNAALLNDEIMRMSLPAIRSDFRAAELYTLPGERRLSCPITVLVGDRDPKCTVDEAREWQEHTRDRFRIRVWPGGHFYLTEHASAVTEELRTAALVEH
ncbi:alpha/beta fold hydrolase [Kineosporia sp. NBRC 101677]|uniref:thioesterase II family protein n=1 Tax=Kineosporia sp. NBRC 101677 TaxID=3032197 RepID=UPI003328D2E0